MRKFKETWGTGCVVMIIVFALVLVIIPSILFIVMGIRYNDPVSLGAGFVVIGLVGIVFGLGNLITMVQRHKAQSLQADMLKAAKFRTVIIAAVGAVIAVVVWVLFGESPLVAVCCVVALAVLLCVVLCTVFFALPLAFLGLGLTGVLSYLYFSGFNFAQTDRTTIINWVRSTDFSEHLAGLVLTTIGGTLILFGFSYMLAAILLRLCGACK